MTKKKLLLYPKVVRQPQDFKGSKIWTVPNQSLSLAEILRRFTRKESLPIEKEGFYETRFGDLEKTANADILEQFEKADEIRAYAHRAKTLLEERDKPVPPPEPPPAKKKKKVVPPTT